MAVVVVVRMREEMAFLAGQEVAQEGFKEHKWEEHRLLLVEGSVMQEETTITLMLHLAAVEVLLVSGVMLLAPLAVRVATEHQPTLLVHR